MSDSLFSDKVRVRACAVVVENSSILLAKIDSPTRSAPIWMPPGGGVEMGETLQKTLIREMNEETGLHIEQKQLLWIHEFIEEPYHAVEFYFRCDVTGGELKKGFDPELQSGEQILLNLSFIPFSKAADYSIEPGFVKEFCENGGKFFPGVKHVISSSG